MSEAVHTEQETTPEPEPKRDVVVKRTSPRGAMIAFIVAALFIGALFGFFGGFLAGRVSLVRDYNGRGYMNMMQSDQQNTPWDNSYWPHMHSNQSDSPSSGTSSGSST